MPWACVVEEKKETLRYYIARDYAVFHRSHTAARCATSVATKTMDELCPLCLKVGSKTKIKAIQVNLTEALWMCENEECPWPFGYEKPSIFTRKVGEKWSFEWQIYRKLKKSVGPIPVSAELSLYTPPVTPSSDGVVKDSVKADLSEATSIAASISDNDVPKSKTVPGDSYAPRSCAEENSTSTKIATSKCASSSKSVAQGSSIISSIFDIDGGDELFGKKIDIEPPRFDARTTESPGCAATETAVLDANVSEPIDDRPDTVLNTSPKSESSIEKSLEVKKTIIGGPAKADNARVPFVRSIARTNIDLQRFVSPSIASKRSPNEIVKTEPWLDSAPVTPPSDLEDRTSKQQHTTTITVEGIPPITLSYDLADLGEKCERLVPLTSTPMQKGTKRGSINAHDNENDDRSEITTESPKKQAKISTNRRAAKGKRYEKFSFSALRKNAQDTKECGEKSIGTVSETIAAANELARVKQDTDLPTKDSSSIKARPESNRCASDSAVQGVPITTSCSIETSNSNKTDESVISVNIDPNCSLANDGRPDDNLNLSLLDDMLLDGYQNATKNLNDDWLESFFT